MADELHKTPVGTTPEPAKVEDKVAEKEKEVISEKSLTQSEVDRIIQERLKRESENSRKERDEAVAKAVAETQKLLKMTSEEREKELAKKNAEELANRDKDLTIRENKLDGINLLNEKKIPIQFIENLVSEDKNKMLENIEVFDKAWKQAISEEVKNQLKGEAPKDVQSANSKKEPVKENPQLF